MRRCGDRKCRMPAKKGYRFCLGPACRDWRPCSRPNIHNPQFASKKYCRQCAALDRKEAEQEAERIIKELTGEEPDDEEE